MKKRTALFVMFFLLLTMSALPQRASAAFENRNGKTYYVSDNGKTVTSDWITVNEKRYYASASGAIYKNCLVNISGSYYGFNKNGVMLTGKKTLKGKVRYFAKKTGKMVTDKFVTISKKKFYFGSDGVLCRNTWVNGCYINAKGYMAASTWISSSRYVGKNGKLFKGLHKISGSYYYFDKKTGDKLVNTTMKLKGYFYHFDENGASKRYKITETRTPSASVEDTYYYHPVVDDLTLLSAIIYCEAGNQRYEGQLAVGMVITNRIRSTSFPNTLKEVVYQSKQFNPTFDGAMERVLNNPSLISASAKKAAGETMKKYQNKDYSFTWKKKTFSFKNYLFFMRKSSYTRLNLASKYKKIQDHVFFKTWKYKTS